MSPHLRPLSIELLGSDDEKEQFFKEFEMTTHLAEFYRSHGRTAELFQLLVEDGQLGPALDVAAANDFQEVTPEPMIENIFSLLHAQKHFWKKENDPEPFRVPTDWKNNLPPYLISASTAWSELSQILSSVKNGEMFGILAQVHNDVVKECLCLYVSKVFF